MALQNIPGNDTLILMALLAVFLIVGYKVLDVLKNALIIAVLSAIFPLVLNRYFGTGFETTLNSELMYVVAGIGMYFIYETMVIALRTGGIVWQLAKVAATPIVWIYDSLKELIGSIMPKENANSKKEARKSIKEDAETEKSKATAREEQN